jgi:hypothetical protein
MARLLARPVGTLTVRGGAEKTVTTLRRVKP